MIPPESRYLVEVFARKIASVGVVCVALLSASPGPAAAEDPPPETGQGNEQTNAELVEDLLSTGQNGDDLVWLYSNADEYSPSDLTGEPVPAPGLPGSGAGEPLVWDPRWRKSGTGNYVLIATTLSLGAVSSFIPPAPARWQSTGSVDEWGRKHLGYDDYDSGVWARDVSDVLLSFEVAFPLLVDSLLVSYWYRQSPEVARELAFITLEVLGVNSFVQGATASFASRERPYGRDCGTSIPEELNHCEQDRRYRSYFSGHTSIAFAGAAVTCSHHLRHRLFGSGLADGLTCGVAMAGAATTGMMRIVGRQHYISDVATGAVIGTFLGFGLPWLLHYDYAGDLGEVSLNVVPTGNGMLLEGTF